MSSIKAIHDFFQSAKLFVFALFLYLGALFAFSHAIEAGLLLLVLLFFLWPYSCKQVTLYLLLSLVGFFSVPKQIPSDVSAMSVSGTLTVDSISLISRYSKPFYSYKVSINTRGTTIPARFTQSVSSQRLLGTFQYRFTGKLVQKMNSWYLQRATFEPDRTIFSLVDIRFDLKQKAKVYLAKNFSPSASRNFLEGVILGEYEDIGLKKALKRFGLQHIVVVSGFHFALLISFLLFLFRFCFSEKASLFFIFCFATAYFLFIGMAPSIFRAYIAALFLILGRIVSSKDFSSFNALGMALLLAVVIDPRMCQEIGFCLSFLATWAILLLFPVVKKFFFSYWPSYRLSELETVSKSEGVIFITSSFLIASLSLILSVTIFMMPMMLYLFGSFPLFGIIYNLFFPFGVSIAMTFFLMGLSFFWFEPVVRFFFSMASTILDTLLSLVLNAPSSFDIELQFSGLSSVAVVLYILAVSLFSIQYINRTV